MKDTIEQVIAQDIIEKCELQNVESLEAWLDKKYKWPKIRGKRVALYKDFNQQPWAKQQLDESDNDCYKKTQIIKNNISELLSKEVNQTDFSSQKSDINFILRLTEFFIEKWGGVNRKNKNNNRDLNSHMYYENLVRARVNINDKENKFYVYQNGANKSNRYNRYKLKDYGNKKFGSVSSWSKFLAILYPQWAHI